MITLLCFSSIRLTLHVSYHSIIACSIYVIQDSCSALKIQGLQSGLFVYCICKIYLVQLHCDFLFSFILDKILSFWLTTHTSLHAILLGYIAYMLPLFCCHTYILYHLLPLFLVSPMHVQALSVNGLSHAFTYMLATCTLTCTTLIFCITYYILPLATIYFFNTQGIS